MHVRLDSHANALNALRLTLALVVVLEHSRSLAHGPGGVFAYAGGFAVDGFFAISGYLIAASRSRTSMRAFLWRRAIRLMPAYWTALACTALLLGPVAARLAGTAYEWDEAVKYMTVNSMLFTPQHGIGNTLSQVPDVGLWNGPLWTLPFEAGAYVIFGLLVAAPGFGPRAAVWVLGVLSCLVLVQYGFGVAAMFDRDVGRLWSFFAAGVLLWAVRERLPSSRWLALTAAVIVSASLGLNHTVYLVVAPLPLAFALLWLGAKLPTQVGARNDISYGLYVLSCPFQQLFIAAGLAAAVGTIGFAVLSVAVAVPIAWASWLVVERPSMRLRRLVPAVEGTRRAATFDSVAPTQ